MRRSITIPTSLALVLSLGGSGCAYREQNRGLLFVGTAELALAGVIQLGDPGEDDHPCEGACLELPSGADVATFGLVVTGALLAAIGGLGLLHNHADAVAAERQRAAARAAEPPPLPPARTLAELREQAAGYAENDECPTALRIADRIRRINADYYRDRVMTDPRFRTCLVP